MSHRLRIPTLAAALAVLVLPATAADSETPPATEQTTGDHSPSDVFESMRKGFRADHARGIHLRYQFHFHEPQGGDWWIIVKDGACTMGKGSIDKPDVTFSCTGRDWVSLSNGDLGGVRAYLTGRLHVSGPQSIARKLDDLFP
jgi:putative sterol carrier protein